MNNPASNRIFAMEGLKVGVEAVPAGSYDLVLTRESSRLTALIQLLQKFRGWPGGVASRRTMGCLLYRR